MTIIPWGSAGAASVQDSTFASLSGIVSDSFGRPVVNAHIVAADGGRQAVTDQIGHFVLRNLRPGKSSFLIRAIGFAPVDFALSLGPREERYVSIDLRSIAARLTAVVINERSTQRILRELGFYDRAASGRGTFLTPEILASRHGALVSDVLRGVNGVRLQRNTRGVLPFSTGGYISIGSNAVCLMNLYIDGSRVEIGSANDQVGQLPREMAIAAQAASISIDDVVAGNDIGAIEVYPSGVSSPQKYTGVSMGCGTILIWTKLKLDVGSGRRDSVPNP